MTAFIPKSTFVDYLWWWLLTSPKMHTNPLIMPLPVDVYYLPLPIGPGKFGIENTSGLLVLIQRYFCWYDFICDWLTASINHIISTIVYLEYEVILQNYGVKWAVQWK